MSTLRVANTGYLSSIQRGMGGLGGKLNENCPAMKNTGQDLTLEVELLNSSAPAQILQPL